MKQQFGLIRRPWGVFYLKNKINGVQTSLKTRDKLEATRLLQAHNESESQPHFNLALARVYINGVDPKLVTRTWQEVMEHIVAKKTDETRRRWETAIKDKNFDCIRKLPVAETRPEHFDRALADGKVSTNVYLRRIHNHALGMEWLLKSVIPRLQWPRPVFKAKRAITAGEHATIIQREQNAERRDFYELLWHTGASQTDAACLLADPNNASGPYSFIGGGDDNTASGAGAVIGGGGYDGSTFSGNGAIGNASVVGGGLGNNISSGGTYGFIGGGQFNTNAAVNSTVSGGADNYIESSASTSTIGGGADNTIQPSATDSTIGGGTINVIQTNAYQSTIAGGNLNTIQINAHQSTIGGGDQNLIQVGANDSTIGGGTYNTNTGAYVAIPGGEYNAAGANSFAAGSYARATNSGSFVWSDDSSTSPFSSTNNNSFNVRAAGGVRFVTGGAGMTLDGLPVLTGSSSGGNYWQTTGNSGTTAGVNFVGTTDNQPLELHVNGGRALRLEPGNGYNAPNVIGGSFINFVVSGAGGATIAGGGTTDSGAYAPITNSVTEDYGTVGGGIGNSAGLIATVGGGYANTASGPETTVSGGEDNIAGTGEYATVGGGYGNTASGGEATVVGGYENTAGGITSFAAGANAKAVNNGSFVWSDGSATTTSTANDQFMVRASGGVIIYSSSANTAGVSLAAGSGTWGMLSDRNAKDGFSIVTPQQVLAKVAELPITEWSYKTEQGVQHIGPMAQDFYAAFRVGEDNKHITEVDESGVALAAIQGLNQKLEETRAENAELKQQNDLLAKRLNQLESVVESLADRK